MTRGEFLDWVEFMEMRGSLHLGMRLEAGFALIATTINRALGGKATLEDFMPHADQDASLEDVMQMLAGGK